MLLHAWCVSVYAGVSSFQKPLRYYCIIMATLIFGMPRVLAATSSAAATAAAAAGDVAVACD
jgi:4-amino-4-deoxy-L-arabinose transferase-like glycosyltransferase